MIIISAAEFVVNTTVHILRGHIPGQILFGGYMVLLIKHKVDLKLICQRKQEQIKFDIVRKNKNTV